MFVAWRDLRFAKGRFALMGTVIVLMTLLTVLLSGLTAGLSQGSISAITGLPADHLAFAAPAHGQKLSFTESTVTSQQWRQWAKVAGVTSAQPLGIATTTATVGSTAATGGAGGGAGGRTAALSAFGVPDGSPLAPDPGKIAPGQAVLSAGAASALKAHPGQVLTVAGHRLAIAAVAGDASYSHTPVIWTSLADWQRLSPATGPAPAGPHATVIALRTTSQADLAPADHRLGTDTTTIAGSLSAIGSYTAENGSLQLMRGFMFAIAALVIGAFFTVWTIQRSGDIAVLKALGATTRYLLRDALGQAVALLAAGAAAGTGLAAAAGALAAGRVPFVLGAATIAGPAIVMIALGSAGAALSIRRITSVDPLTALGSAR